MRAVLESPRFLVVPRDRRDLLRYRGVAYDRLGGDLVPTPVPEGYLGIIETGGRGSLLTETAQGLPCPHGERGWVYCHRSDDGWIQVSAREHVQARPSCWGTSTRSLLGLRPNESGRTRLWQFGVHVVWLRPEHRVLLTPSRCDAGEGPWPRPLVDELFRAGECAVMMDDAPLSGLPTGAVVLLEAEESLVLGIAATPGELATFLREDHVNHYIVVPSSGGALHTSLLGDLPRRSVAHQDVGDRRAVVYIERLADRTTSYTVADGAVISVLDKAIDHHTGVPGLNGAWVERRRPGIVRWPTGSWTDGSPVESLQSAPDHEHVRVMTGRTCGYRQIDTTAPDADDHADAPFPRLPETPAPTGGRQPAVRVGGTRWVPPADDPVAGVPAAVVTRNVAGHDIEVVAAEWTQRAVPLVWFDSAWTVPGVPANQTLVDIGRLPVGSAQWCHAGLRPVIRVGIDYEALARTEPEQVRAVLGGAWRAALAAVSETLPNVISTPYLGGHSFGAALAAIAVLDGIASPAGVILRSGAYDRYATPGGFEHDERTVASAPDLYRIMTVVPRAHAHRGVPFLLTCGDSDENSVTTPRQSRTLYENLTLWGADATLIVFPGEGHEFSFRRSILDERRLEDEWMSQAATDWPTAPASDPLPLIER